MQNSEELQCHPTGLVLLERDFFLMCSTSHPGVFSKTRTGQVYMVQHSHTEELQMKGCKIIEPGKSHCI